MNAQHGRKGGFWEKTENFPLKKPVKNKKLTGTKNI